ncbi:MAG TPA: cupin domain-containing protein [Candidatus Acidoferrum sp.]|nr:cupin domain-containing protein [Candidatus Acidoferrum sp.]
MSAYKIDFDALEWQEGRDGVRFKLYSEGNRLLRLVEFSTTDGYDGWCEQGHIGYVLQGGLVIDCNGKVVTLKAGDGMFLPSGHDDRHRAISIEVGTRLVLVEDA